jgi:hypothetical protein
MFFLVPTAIFIIVSEMIRYFRIRNAATGLFSSNLSFPLNSLALFGKQASITEKFYKTKDSAMFLCRGRFSDQCKGMFLAYHWSWKSLVEWTPRTIGPLQLIVSDGSIALPILQDTDTWVKPRVGPPFDIIVGQSCARARGPCAIRHRRVLAAALRNPKDFFGCISFAASAFSAQIANLISSDPSDRVPVSIDVQPLLHRLSLDINIWTIVGQYTDGVETFSKESVCLPART